MLLEHKIDLTVIDDDTNPPLNVLADKMPGKLNELVPMFLYAGADPNQTNSDGSSFIHYASKYFVNEETYNLLFERGVKVDVLNNYKRNAVIIAGACNNVNAMKILSKNNANINQQDGETGKTAAMEAVLAGGIETLTELDNMGANFKIKDNFGYNVAHYIVESLGWRGEDLCDKYYLFLKKHKNLLSIKNNQTLTPLDMIQMKGDTFYSNFCKAIENDEIRIK